MRNIGARTTEPSRSSPAPPRRSSPQSIEDETADALKGGVKSVTRDRPVPLRPDLAKHHDEMRDDIRIVIAKLAAPDSVFHDLAEELDVAVHVSEHAPARRWLER